MGLGSTGWFKSVLVGVAGIVSGTTRQQTTFAPQDIAMNEGGVENEQKENNRQMTSNL
ncbi:hypothetical protein [Paenibacillus sp. IHBB 10380]|uniref:hypothetical protein n=1 Tax=Paenibacillus sp. IHBB 10380 TaxID=1566358 RepID=UPI000AE84CDF|nr:hypothetical protein [Paenibacillus sp. IHBB 10380]